ncbi:TPA: efflux RND transporter periplasmic adaptor subunit [Citrobacter farmeri]|uniref:Efflux RND transporter periplasmic adaptor subunit n=2 Tax=Citrobacter farmeri TaxID=67824 RepID=A0ACA8DC66_9ENTR|nr:efflux RND transporter periplasmic adaptor subunit [Citrobacter farmeri]HAT2168735.1 efflux RND transporter periplasmic adaptor subunit [Citrobacter freundii]AST81726.1 efflux RND transporter periplasmic adaptor subunit [Citrobacter farmeri]EMB4691296.1 efflux RND transporter periplasmic adaptor subunit [Citrobacter farmeri]MCP1694561.1 macrolide-specific efflux system membrane fusion protein [Citrobacter farmeri]MCW2424856.1 macrolide-specific efflux system membrane fusion protein [Citroba
MTLKSRWLPIGCGLALVVAVAGTWVSMASTPTQENLPLETIGTGDIEKVVLVTGVLKPAVQVNVGAQVNGQLRKLYVRQGEKVQKGQLLAEIDPTLQESDLNNTRAQLASAKAQKLSAQATLLRYRQELNRQSMMLRDGSGVRSEYEQARAQYDAQVQQIDVSDAQIVQAEMAVKTAQANLSYTRIVAPIDGEVLGIVTREGQTIVSSQTAPTILVLADLDTMQVQTRISEADVQKIRPGQPLRFYVIANPDKRYTSTMGFVQPAPQEALEAPGDGRMGGNQQAMAVYYTGTFEVPNAGRELKTSMTAQVFIQIAEAKNVLRVPVAALGQALDTERYTITTVEDGQTRTRTIRIGINDRQYAEVLEGLQAGDRVVLAQDTVRG